MITRYTFVFDKLETPMARGYAHAKRTKDRYSAPPGAYGYRHDKWGRVTDEIRESLLRDGDRSPYVMSRIFGDTQIACNEALDAFSTFANEYGTRKYKRINAVGLARPAAIETTKQKYHLAKVCQND